MAKHGLTNPETKKLCALSVQVGELADKIAKRRYGKERWSQCSSDTAPYIIGEVYESLRAMCNKAKDKFPESEYAGTNQ